jgi:hypothetical protein
MEKHFVSLIFSSAVKSRFKRRLIFLKNDFSLCYLVKWEIDIFYLLEKRYIKNLKLLYNVRKGENGASTNSWRERKLEWIRIF